MFTTLCYIALKPVITMVYLPLIVWLLLAMVMLVWLLVRFPLNRRYNLANPNPHNGETMGIPRGFFRGVITITLLIAAMLLEIYSIAYLDSDAKFSRLLDAFELMLAFYFGSKVMHHLSSVDRSKTKAVAEAKLTKSTEPFNDPQANG